MKISVCWKWSSLDAEREADPRWSGVSAADEAALEIALVLADGARAGGATVEVVALGPPAADDTLRGALAVGADSVVRVDASTALDSATVAEALAPRVGDADLVVCGDYSVDRGSGSTPAYLAAELGAAQALGLVDVTTDGFTGTGPLRVVRRLDGGRRELLEVPLPAVISLEGAVARLRRASMAASLATRRAPITQVAGPFGHPPHAEVHPYRPRPRTITVPHGDALDRVRALLDIGSGSEARTELVTLDPPAAAARIVDQLREWGYLEQPGTS